MGRKIIIKIFLAVCFILLVLYLIPFFHKVSLPFPVGDYDVTFEKGHAIVDYYNGNDKNVKIPKYILFRPVTQIGRLCFHGRDIETITIPSTVSLIGDDAFGECEKLKSVEYDGDEIYLEEMAFYYCKSLKSIDWDDRIVHLDGLAFCDSGLELFRASSKLEYIGCEAFAGTPFARDYPGDFVVIEGTMLDYKGSDSVIVVPNIVNYIRANSFDTRIKGDSITNSSFITEIYFPDSVKEIDKSQFWGEIDTITLYIPSSITLIGDGLEGKGMHLFVEYYREGTENEHLKIVTTAGSYAEEYAKKFDIPYEIVDSWEVPET